MKTPTRGDLLLFFFLLFGLGVLSLVNCHNIGSVGEVLLDENERYKDVHQIWNIEEVEKIEWSSSSPFAEEMAKRTTPVVLRNTNASTNWAPMNWSYESIMTTLGGERKIPVHELKQHTMMLFRNFPEFGSWPGTKQIYETKEYTIRQLINELKKSTTPFSPSTSSKKEDNGKEEEEMEEVILERTYLYAPFDIIESFSPVLFNVIQPTSFFNVKPKLRKPGEAPPKQHVTLWLGSAGVTTQIHFDLDENFHLQIKGNKRFLLVPPTEHNKLYLHSRIHPSYRRSQAQLHNVDLKSFPRFKEIKGALEVTLKPGDLLYIPPLWFHHVTNINAGLSINVFSESDQMLIWDEIQKSRPSFKDLPDKSLRYVFAKKFLLELCKGLGTAALSTHFDQHYSHFIRENRALGFKPSSDTSKLITSACNNEGMWRQLEALGSIQTTIDTIVKRFKTIKDDATRELILSDYMDRVAFSLVEGDHLLVPVFFRACFRNLTEE